MNYAESMSLEYGVDFNHSSSIHAQSKGLERKVFRAFRRYFKRGHSCESALERAVSLIDKNMFTDIQYVYFIDRIETRVRKFRYENQLLCIHSVEFYPALDGSHYSGLSDLCNPLDDPDYDDDNCY